MKRGWGLPIVGVLVIAAMTRVLYADDIEIVGCDRGALDHAGGTTDDDEFDPRIAQLREQRW